jgi:hypothetical protein
MWVADFLARFIGYTSDGVYNHLIKLLVNSHEIGLRGLEVTFPHHDPSDAGSNPSNF